MLIKKIALVSLISLGLVACAAKPTQVIVAPIANHVPASTLTGKQALLVVKDMRPAPHVVQYRSEGEATKILSASAPLTETIKQSFTEQFGKQGLRFSSVAPNTITVTIESLLSDVDQGTVNYTAINTITLNVAVSNGFKTLTKTHQIKGTSKGVLTADLAVLERDLNQQLGKVISQVVTNPEIAKALK